MRLNVPSEDHRTRTAERRRDAMRARLVESAMLTFAEKGVDAAVIDDVITAAGVSRGTFYKYFTSTHEVMLAVSTQIGNELLAIVETQVSAIRQPDERIAVGLRLFMETARSFPVLATFTRMVGLEAVGPAMLINTFLPPHLKEGIDKGLFFDVPLSVHLDLITGAVLLCIVRVAQTEVGSEHIGQMVASIMRGLGVPTERAGQLAHVDVAPIDPPADSLLRRAQVRLQEAQA